jgi:AcrR family transcriptional regulator
LVPTGVAGGSVGGARSHALGLTASPGLLFSLRFNKLNTQSNLKETVRAAEAEPSPRTTRVELRRYEILRSLGLVLQERGLAGITMDEIARKLGMTKGSLYYYFEDKDDLLYQCHLRCIPVSMKALRKSRSKTLPPDIRLRELLISHVRGITDEVYGAVILTDLESISPRRRRRIVALRDAFERGVRGMIREGIEQGIFRKVDIKLAGFAMLGAINWIPKWYDPRGRLSSVEIAEQFADFFVSALRA